jgi:alcohol dehydrogenase (cytochrome c)
MNGAERLGDNLYTASVVALSAKTGQLKWYFQFTPHDTHDWDSTQPMLLVDRQWQGRDRKLLLHADKNGYFFVLDRVTGELLLAQPLSAKVTWTTGYGKDGRPILTDSWQSSPEGTVACPGALGGANWPDTSFNPITGLFYVRVSDSCAIASAGDDPLTAGNRWFGSGRPSDKAREELAKITTGYAGSYIRAFDIGSGKKVWEYSVTEKSGILSTAGLLVFIGGPGGLAVLNAKTGAEVSHVDIGLPPTASLFAASPMTYMVDGKQYIALAATGEVVAYRLAD